MERYSVEVIMCEGHVSVTFSVGLKIELALCVRSLLTKATEKSTVKPVMKLNWVVIVANIYKKWLMQEVHRIVLLMWLFTILMLQIKNMSVPFKYICRTKIIVQNDLNMSHICWAFLCLLSSFCCSPIFLREDWPKEEKLKYSTWSMKPVLTGTFLPQARSSEKVRQDTLL